jgi:hypothetical protein
LRVDGANADCANSTKSSNCIRLVGSAGGIADPAGVFTVTVRDCVPNPIPGVTVTFDFSACSDTHVGGQADQPFPGLTVDSGTRTVSAVTDINGVARFDIVGAVNPATRATVAPASCAKIYADGVLLSNVTIEAIDQDGVSGAELADLALWASDFYSAQNQRRSDYDCNASVALPDLSIWASEYFSHASQSSAGAYAW